MRLVFVVFDSFLSCEATLHLDDDAVYMGGVDSKGLTHLKNPRLCSIAAHMLHLLMIFASDGSYLSND